MHNYELTLEQLIKAKAYELGLDACGIARAEAVDEETENRYRSWIEAGHHASMEYMARNIEKRMNPALLLETEVRSVIVVALNYYPAVHQSADIPQIARFAYGNDYHFIVKEKLNALLEYICQLKPETTGRAFTDSAPVLERYWGRRAGIGFIGKNNCLIIPQKGSYFFLGILLVNTALQPDQPIEQQCSTCQCCIAACPTNALYAPYRINAQRCISYQTIEKKEAMSKPIKQLSGNAIFGCDRCQEACPHNKFATPHTHSALKPVAERLCLSTADWLNMDNPTFNRLFKNSPLKRAGLQKIIASLIS